MSKRSHFVMLPSPSRISVENADAVRDCGASPFGSRKGECFVGVANRNVSADNGCDLIVGNPSNKVKNGAREVGV